MRRRSYRPEPPTSLEDRSLLSGVAAASVGPVAVTSRRLGDVFDRVGLSFTAFTRNSQIDLLRGEVLGEASQIPFTGVNGVESSINAIIDDLQGDRRSHSPMAARLAQRQVVNVIRASVLARVRAGDLVVTR